MSLTYGVPAERVKLQNHMEYIQFINNGNKPEDFVYNLAPFCSQDATEVKSENQTRSKNNFAPCKRAKSVLTQSQIQAEMRAQRSQSVQKSVLLKRFKLPNLLTNYVVEPAKQLN